jgi:hypothetical protein
MPQTISAAERNSGLWVINKKRMMIYARKELPPGKRLDAAIRLQKEGPKKQPKLTIVGAEGE